jgi:hypothetical protein
VDLAGGEEGGGSGSDNQVWEGQGQLANGPGDAHRGLGR